MLLHAAVACQVTHQIEEGNGLARAWQPLDGRHRKLAVGQLVAHGPLFVEARIQVDQGHLGELVQAVQDNRVVGLVVMADGVDQDRVARRGACAAIITFDFSLGQVGLAERDPPEVIVVALDRGAPPAGVVAGGGLHVGGAPACAQEHLGPGRLAAGGRGQVFGTVVVGAMFQEAIARHERIVNG